ncbi:MAG: flagellar basal-body rod protein FlgF [Deltaproteobacteria bacterium]|jgi:flagellar basal-body rod protein FlgG|nr:flagellar basal-body rod protein FlgF [Deltaproteobacteria bacterium]
MSGGIYMAASGALAYEKRLQIISNNLANASTVGYKMDHGQFQFIDPADLPAAFVPDSPEVSTSQAQSFWFQFSSYTDFSHGSLKNTGNDFDLALIGDGFFCVQKPDGVHYTRKGDFTLNDAGVLVTRNGYPVLGDGGEITVDASAAAYEHKKFAVDEDGNVSVDGQQVGRLRIVEFPETGSLMKMGDTLFKPADNTPPPQEAEDYKVSQGFVELSNVDVVKMMTEMIEVLRGYESYQKVIRSADEATARSINEGGEV